MRAPARKASSERVIARWRRSKSRLLFCFCDRIIVYGRPEPLHELIVGLHLDRMVAVELDQHVRLRLSDRCVGELEARCGERIHVEHAFLGH